MATQELITLQVGNYSNYVGAHYWNFHYKRMLYEQRSDEGSQYVNKLFRETYGHTSRNRFFPRMICFDIKTKLQSLKQDGTFNESCERIGINDGKYVNFDYVNCTLHTEEPIEKIEFIKLLNENDQNSRNFYDLDNKVCSWSDFMMYELHDNSVQLLHDTYSDGEEFHYFGLGTEEYKSLKDDFEDNLHFWVEECDYIEGFQIFSDAHNGYCGVMSKMLEDISDDYNKKSKLTFLNWSLDSDQAIAEKQKVYHYLNIALTLQSMKEYSSLSVLQSTDSDLLLKTANPVKIPNIKYKREKLYHTSAILAAAIDSSTIPLYQDKSPVSLSQCCYEVNQGHWFLAGSSFGIPINRNTAGNNLLNKFLQSTNGFYENCMTSLFPCAAIRDHVKPSSHLIVLQNTPSGNIVCPAVIDSLILQKLGLNRNIFNQDPYSILEFFNERFYPCENTSAKLCYSNQKLRSNAPFPDIIERCIEDEKRTDFDTSTMSSLYTSPQFYKLIDEVTTNVKKMNLHQFHIVEEFGLDKDILEELLEDLLHMRQTYSCERTSEEMEE